MNRELIEKSIKHLEAQRDKPGTSEKDKYWYNYQINIHKEELGETIKEY